MDPGQGKVAEGEQQPALEVAQEALDVAVSGP
jgi:hypothetical protein